MNLDGKIILVTGGSGLLGRAILTDIKQNNGTAINLDINADNNIDKGEINLDITSDKSIKQAITTILKKHKRIDGLVNNAYPRTSDWGKAFEDVNPDSFSKNIDMQLSRIFALSQPVLEIMKKQGYGSLVHMSSVYGIVGNDFTVYENTPLTSPAAYSAIKGGLINFSRYLASYFGKYNVRSNCVSPGGIFDHQNKIFVEQYEYRVPMKRMGTPKDIAPIVSFLLSDDSSYITGQNIAVDGGWTAI
ncbi:SDR family oxidoreductase [Eudoraea chungangensis]|uniref:SDR family oxidoreductase n=1 Tax=Eudoraea chungangensis TaxID=1481905 RepID=UPI0023EC0799|nr:SDR family oxidoreductase [Eudoraea chungangensis]